jgi:hypothetical protein
MNAYELADELKKCIDDGSTDLVCVCGAVNMLRQQADRIERKQELIREQTALLVKQNNRIAELEKAQIKELSDDEIQEISHDFGEIAWLGETTYKFAREILKKASEK